MENKKIRNKIPKQIQNNPNKIIKNNIIKKENIIKNNNISNKIIKNKYLKKNTLNSLFRPFSTTNINETNKFISQKKKEKK